MFNNDGIAIDISNSSKNSYGILFKESASVYFWKNGTNLWTYSLAN